MDLKLVAFTKPSHANPILARRHRLVRRLGQQLAMISGTNDTALPRSSWIWLDESGTYFLSINYGRDPIEIKKGMYAIQCENLEAAKQAMMTIKDMALKGELDDQLAKISASIRAKFKSTAAGKNRT